MIAHWQETILEYDKIQSYPFQFYSIIFIQAYAVLDTLPPNYY